MSGNIGLMSCKEFVAGANLFSKISRMYGENWSFENEESEDDSVFLRKREIITVNLSSEKSEKVKENAAESDLDEVMSCNEDIVEDDSLAMSTHEISVDAQHITFEYHITYSISYQVPVLYFNVYRQDGSLVKLEDVWNTVPVSYQQRLREERWTFITQQEHPVLNQPFYQLHPCYTERFMSSVPCVAQTSNLAERFKLGDIENDLSVARYKTSDIENDLSEGINRIKMHTKPVESSGFATEGSRVGSGVSGEVSSEMATPRAEEMREESGRSSIKCSTEAKVGFRYLLAWLSAVGPVVHVRIPLAMATVRLCVDL